jgi:hypothetical protein
MDFEQDLRERRERRKSKRAQILADWQKSQDYQRERDKQETE